jgi:hypothetical protein
MSRAIGCHACVCARHERDGLRERMQRSLQSMKIGPRARRGLTSEDYTRGSARALDRCSLDEVYFDFVANRTSSLVAEQHFNESDLLCRFARPLQW